MAKKDALEQFLAEVLETVPEDRRQAFEETLKSAPVAAVVRERVMARSDYSRSKDELDSKVAAFNAEVQQAKTNLAGWAKWYEEETSKAGARQASLEAYEKLYGKLDGTTVPDKHYTTSEDVSKTIADTMRERDAAAIQFADMLTDLKLDYKDKFGKRLDTKELLKMAGEKGLPLDVAYDRYIASDIDTAREKDIEVRIAKAKEEGRKEALTNTRMPYQSGPTEPHVLDAPADVPKNPRDRVAAAIADWNLTDHVGAF